MYLLQFLRYYTSFICLQAFYDTNGLPNLHNHNVKKDCFIGGIIEMDAILYVIFFIMPTVLCGIIMYILLTKVIDFRFITKYYDKLYVKYANNSYLLYKKLRPRRPMDMRDWVLKYISFDYMNCDSSNYLKCSDCQSLTYNEFIRYIEVLFKVSKRLVIKDKQVLDMLSSAPMSEEDIYEFIHKEILKALDKELDCYYFEKLIRSNASDFLLFLDRNRPSTIPPLEECPQSKMGYYACMGNIKSHLCNKLESSAI